MSEGNPAPGTDPEPGSSVEVDFPYREVNELAASESYNKHHYRPTNYQHKWWARRLGSVFRSLCLSALSDAESTAEDVWKRYTQANDFEDAVVLDPFMGGGTTGQEAIDGSGLRVVNTYPVRGENRLSVHINGQRAIQLDSAIVCRKDHKQPTADWTEVAQRIENESWDRLSQFHESDDEDLSLLDASVVVRGACMTHFSKYEQVLDDGEPVDEREAMNRIEAITAELNDREF